MAAKKETPFERLEKDLNELEAQYKRLKTMFAAVAKNDLTVLTDLARRFYGDIKADADVLDDAFEVKDRDMQLKRYKAIVGEVKSARQMAGVVMDHYAIIDQNSDGTSTPAQIKRDLAALEPTIKAAASILGYYNGMAQDQIKTIREQHPDVATSDMESETAKFRKPYIPATKDLTLLDLTVNMMFAHEEMIRAGNEMIRAESALAEHYAAYLAARTVIVNDPMEGPENEGVTIFIEQAMEIVADCITLNRHNLKSVKTEKLVSPHN